MNKRIKYFLLVLPFTFLSCINGKVTTNEQSSEQLPNIVYILCDDAGWGDLSCYGQKNFSTPNIDALAQRGMKFTDHYAGSSVCSPSRATLFTGLHTGHAPIRGNKEVFPEGQHPLPKKAYTITRLLKEKGYVTGMFGKWGLGYPHSEGAPNTQGFDEFFGYNCQRLAHTYFPMYLRHNGEKVLLDENYNDAKNEYAHSLIHQKALEFIDKQNEETPFFLYLPYTIPHAEMLVPNDTIFERFKQQYTGTPFLDKKNSDENWNQEKRFIHGVYGDQEYPRAAFATMMTYLDRSVGDIMKKLQDKGLEENTIVMFSSDNGPHIEGGADPYFFNSFGPFRGVKRDLYEGGIRVPMIVSWKGKIKEGSETNHPSAFWDVLPTIAELTKATIPEGHKIDGISFLPTLLGKENQKEHNYLYWEFHGAGGRVATRFDHWKSVQYQLNQPNISKVELYDLSKDPKEENNVADQYPEIVEKVRVFFENARTKNSDFKLPGENVLLN
ncbi:sulfatase-like hydrolase/transferase [Flammeovirga yaeyamensis]|uniref:Sulfatase-like hydrolase/transferase n=1 Tax=Flammeovirga yaeyamensis TaxID=367791 RepID=A0AAX1N6A9_9BACT|nr:arylsulfatase [Flammeovirga yaeyamensis]MBB3697574.1 arylsulfatase A-like enzyme [Flammeovirga yaeyamensis]NMF36266.1 arylsulfatase [Flammeovirga yaeyamensis]QWG02995.1 sulfatase-like hydrolase/transferase [Flammeovirga yaeyamensis]